MPQFDFHSAAFGDVTKANNGTFYGALFNDGINGIIYRQMSPIGSPKVFVVEMCPFAASKNSRSRTIFERINRSIRSRVMKQSMGILATYIGWVTAEHLGCGAVHEGETPVEIKAVDSF